MQSKAILILAFFSLTLPSESFGLPNPKYGPQAQRLYLNHDYVKKNAAIDYWSMAGYYVPQFNGRACSVASVSAAVNAAKAPLNLTSSTEIVTQETLIKEVGNGAWAKAVGDGGSGVTLDQLGSYAKESLEWAGLKDVSVQVVHSDGSKKSDSEIIGLLSKNEKSGEDLILVNFLQSEFTGDPEGAVGHIAPVAAYDEKNKKVLIMDPDRQYYEPYWVSVETFLKGVTTEDKSVKKNRGIVYLRFKR